MKQQDLEPQDWQESHSPTVQTEVVISHSPRRVTAGPRRRTAEDRLWNGFTADETRAAEELCRIWAYLTHGLTAKAQKYERTDPARDDARDIAIHLVQVHRRWRLSTRAAEQSVCQAVLFDGMGIAEAAKAYRKAAGWPRLAIGNCLGRWIELRGWA